MMRQRELTELFFRHLQLTPFFVIRLGSLRPEDSVPHATAVCVLAHRRQRYDALFKRSRRNKKRPVSFLTQAS